MDRKKILIVTLYGNQNYGNRLQNLALNELLKEKGCETRSVGSFFSKEDFVKGHKPILNEIPAVLLFFILTVLKSVKLGIMHGIRSIRFSNYCKKYIDYEKRIIVNHNSDIKNCLDGYDIYISGSDQVWNPEFRNRYFYMLGFVEKNKSFSFSASIGNYDYDFQNDDEYINLINDFQNISVREGSAESVLNGLVNKKITVDVDPTILLGAERWRLLKTPFHIRKENYLLAFFLGKKNKRKISDFAKRKKLSIIYINDKKDFLYYTINPGEFLFAIDNASYVMTDSFHGTVFSILFHKQFYVFDRIDNDRKNMFSRISDLLFLLDLNERIKTWDNIFDDDDISYCKWKQIDSALNSEREESVSLIYKLCGIEKD